MKYVTHKEPFDFAELHGVFEDSEFELILGYAKEILLWDKVKIHKLILESNGLRDLETKYLISDTSLDRHIFNLLSKKAYTLKEIFFPTFGIEGSTFYGFEFAAHNNAKAKQGIHTDSPHKLMSAIVHLSENGDATRIYNEDKELAFQAEWQQNCGVIFKRSEKSWHAIGEPIGCSRVILNMIFFTDGNKNA